MCQMHILFPLNSSPQDAHFTDEEAMEMEATSVDFLKWEMGWPCQGVTSSTGIIHSSFSSYSALTFSPRFPTASPSERR